MVRNFKKWEVFMDSNCRLTVKIGGSAVVSYNRTKLDRYDWGCKGKDVPNVYLYLSDGYYSQVSGKN